MRFVIKKDSNPESTTNHIMRDDGLPMCGVGRKKDNWVENKASFASTGNILCESCRYHVIKPEDRAKKLKELRQIRMEMAAKIRQQIKV
jgi:hypothetical protein